MTCSFVPPYLLRRLADAGDRRNLLTETRDPCRSTLLLDEQMRARRAAGPAPSESPSDDWIVHDARNGRDLPGIPARRSDQTPTGDAAVDEAAEGTAASLRLLSQVFGRDSYDGQGATAIVTVHYERDYVNAFWDGTQLVLGDGDGRVFDRFTKAIDVLGHELAHALTQYTTNLAYADQSGALNESISDVFAACLLQWTLDQSVDEASWIIGEELFLPGVRARGLRDMAAPGTAYDDPALGRDPQVGSMVDYVVTDDDNGGVHLNSGIANRAFHLAAIGIGGRAWQGAGAIWFDAITGGDVGPNTDFAGFAAATIAAAGPHAGVVEQAWRTVGVTSADVTPTRPGSTAGANVVAVRRSGGLLGHTRSAEVDLDGDDPRAPAARRIVAEVDLRQVAATTTPQPDRFVYLVVLPGVAPVRVPEQGLTEPLHRLVHLLLGDV